MLSIVVFLYTLPITFPKLHLANGPQLPGKRHIRPMPSLKDVLSLPVGAVSSLDKMIKKLASERGE